MVKLIDLLHDYLFVPKCAVCRTRMDRGDTGICERCRFAYEDLKAEYCDFCGMEASICTCMPQNLLMNGCTDYRKLAFYKTGGEANAVRSMVYSVKRKHPLALMRFLAREMVVLDRDGITAETVVTFAPRSPKALQKYGYDQAKLLAKFFAKESGCDFRTLLCCRLTKKHTEQKLLNYSQRAANVRGAFVLRNAKSVRGKDVLLIDDVVTSGSTIGECISMLYGAGAKSVACRSIAYTYRKNKHKKD